MEVWKNRNFIKSMKMGVLLYKMISKKKKSMIPEFKQCSNDQDIITYLYSYSVKITTNLQNEISVLMEISITYSNLIFLEMFKISIKTKCHGYDPQRIQIIKIYLLE